MAFCKESPISCSIKYAILFLCLQSHKMLIVLNAATSKSLVLNDAYSSNK